jgi:Phenazine biosynthesis-like protein
MIECSFAQIDEFSANPYLGNPIAMMLGADDLTDVAMQRLAPWTNLSETTFLVRATTLVGLPMMYFELAHREPSGGSTCAMADSGGRVTSWFFPVSTDFKDAGSANWIEVDGPSAAHAHCWAHDEAEPASSARHGTLWVEVPRGAEQRDACAFPGELSSVSKVIPYGDVQAKFDRKMPAIVPGDQHPALFVPHGHLHGRCHRCRQPFLQLKVSHNLRSGNHCTEIHRGLSFGLGRWMWFREFGSFRRRSVGLCR